MVNAEEPPSSGNWTAGAEFSQMFDVFIPYWGDVELAKEAVRSVLKQTHAGWHLTVLDDQYPSRDFQNWVEGLGDPRITYLVNPENLGFPNNFNKAASMVKEDHAVILGCDDVMGDMFLTRAAEVLSANPEVAMYQPSVTVIDEKGEINRGLVDRVKRLMTPRQSGLYSGEKIAASLMRGDWMYFPSIVWNRHDLQAHAFNDERGIITDLDFIIKILLDGGQIYVDRSLPTFSYRRHKGSVSSVGAYDGERFEQERAFFQDVALRFQDQGWRKASRAARHHLTSRAHALFLSVHAIRHGGDMRTIFDHVLR